MSEHDEHSADSEQRLGGGLLPRQPLTAASGRPRMASRRIASGELVVGEWSLAAAAFTDLHQHVEINHVLEGELHVTWDGQTQIATVGDTVIVPAGSVGRYAAPVYARMLFVYGPSDDGHAATHMRYEEL